MNIASMIEATVAKSNKIDEKPAESFGHDDKILLGVLEAVERDANTSQRGISRELDVALGLANAYLKRCVRKGLIKIKQVPRRRYAYYLTPRGFSEKSRLAAQYFSASFTFFRRARNQISDLMNHCNGMGWNRIAFAGASELAEVGVICAQDFSIKVVAVIDQARAGQKFCGLPVHASAAECEPLDVVIITEIAKPEPVYRAVENEVGVGRILAPPLLRSSLPQIVAPEAPPRAAE